MGGGAKRALAYNGFMSSPPPPETVAATLIEESRRKRKRIAGSLWPRARLTGEILYHQVGRDRLFMQASALTYKTLFSLLPIFVLSLLVLSMISAGNGKDALDATVKATLFEQLGIDRMTIGEGGEASEQGVAARAPGTQGEGGDATTEPGGGSEGATTRAGKVSLASFLEPLIETAKKSVTNKGTGLIALGILLYGAISLMIVIEGTFNQIFGSVKARTWLRRLTLYWCVLTLGPLGVAASITLGNSAYHVATTGAGISGSSWVISTMQMVSAFAVSWLVILLLYKLIPDTHVKWRPAIIGAFVAAISWEIGKWAFGMYVQRAVRNSWYGSLALLPLFMFWIYITWSVVLIGLELTYVQQYWPMLKRRFFFLRAGGAGTTMVSDLRWVLSLGAYLYRQFKLGKMTEVHEAAEALMLPNDIVEVLLEGLECSGLVHEVRPGAYALARPPESITAHDLLVAARGLCQVPPELMKEASHATTYRVSEAVKSLEELENSWAKVHALPALAGEK